MGLLDMNAVKGMGKNLGTSAKGMLADGAGEKAILLIPNPKYFDQFTEKEGKGSKFLNDEATKVENDLIERIGGKKDDTNDKAKAGLEAAKNKTFGQKALGALKTVGNTISPFLPGGNLMDPDTIGEVYKRNDKFIKVTVQFNPETIKMHSMNGKVQNMAGADEATKMVQNKTYVGKTKLSFTLFFDDMDLTNAFGMQEITSMNASKVIEAANTRLANMRTNFSVHKRMEAMLSLLSCVASQQVIFYWSKMCFRGAITAVSNTYTMFNSDGNPIRGTMHIDMVQDNKTSDNYEYPNLAWEKSFEKVFSKEGSNVSKTGKVFSAISNNAILNL